MLEYLMGNCYLLILDEPDQCICTDYHFTDMGEVKFRNGKVVQNYIPRISQGFLNVIF